MRAFLAALSALTFVACSKAPLAPSSALASAAPSSHALFETASAALGTLVITGSADTVPFGSYTTIRVVFSDQVNGAIWDFGDGTTSSLLRTTMQHFYPAPGRYHVFLTATSFAGASERVDGFVDVLEGAPHTPTPRPADNPAPPGPSTPLFDAFLSVVSGGRAGTATRLAVASTTRETAIPNSFAWDCTTDGVIDAVTAVNSYDCIYRAPGTYTASVVVANGTMSVSRTITGAVGAADAVVSVLCQNVTLPTQTACSVSVNLNGETVPAGQIVRIDWTFGDATAQTTGVGVNTANHAYAVAGTYAVGATITVTTLVAPMVGSTSTRVS